MKRIAFIPLAVVLLTASAAIVSCDKTLPATPSPGSGVQSTPNGMRFGGNNWNTLWYFGTPDYSGCVTPCGMCHTTPWQIGHQPNGDDPQNNEALTEISIIRGNILHVSVDLSDVGAYYVNYIRSSAQLNVSTFTSFPESVIHAVCDDAGIAHWPGAVGVAAGVYPVQVQSTAPDARLEIEGKYDASTSTGWSWTCFVR